MRKVPEVRTASCTRRSLRARAWLLALDLFVRIKAAKEKGLSIQPLINFKDIDLSDFAT